MIVANQFSDIASNGLLDVLAGVFATFSLATLVAIVRLAYRIGRFEERHAKVIEDISDLAHNPDYVKWSTLAEKGMITINPQAGAQRP